MDKEKLIKRLMTTFLGEFEEHAAALNGDLLALEKAAGAHERAVLVKTLFRTAHSLKGAAQSVHISPVESACHRLETLLTPLRDGVRAPSPDQFAQLLLTADALQDASQRLHAGQDLVGAPLADLLLRPATVGRIAGPAREAAAPVALPASAGPLAPGGSTSSVRIPAERLDMLLAQCGELQVARHRVAGRGAELGALQEFVRRWQAEWRRVEKPLQHVLAQNGGRARELPRRAATMIGRTRDNLRRLTQDLERLAAAQAGDGRQLAQAAAPLEAAVRRMRMLPFAEACQGLGRAVRDLGQAAGKVVDLVVESGDAQLDRAILEMLKAPLLHLVRNAIDHGVESPIERAAAGKPARARITVRAELRGPQVEISVQDDGRGVNLEAIREQSRRKHIPVQDDRELLDLIFRPGLSTSPIITELSGRGVGLDVVKSQVELLHGTVALSFVPGQGTRFALTVPLTLTTIRVLLVTAAGQTFALAANNVQRLLRVSPGDICSVGGREVLRLGGTPVPVCSLAAALGWHDAQPAGEVRVPVVVLAAGDQRLALVVDELLAQQECVVKSLGARLKRVRNISGATILADGRIALILNAANLIRSALRRAPGQLLAGAPAGPTTQAKRRLLVVDDSVTTRTLEKSILEAAGFEVMVAVDGVEAWQLLQARDADLVVSDVEMPRMDGFTLAATIRASKRFRDLPIVLVTALAGERDQARGIEVGADAYLVKSDFDQQNLLETIAQLL